MQTIEVRFALYLLTYLMRILSSGMGERICQMIIARHEKAEWISVETLMDTDRGSEDLDILENNGNEKKYFSDNDFYCRTVFAISCSKKVAPSVVS